MWEVLRWFAVFVLAILLLVAGLFWLMGRDLPIPNFYTPQADPTHHWQGLVIISLTMTTVAAALP